MTRTLEEVRAVTEQLEPERVRSCRNASTMASVMIDEIRLRAHARPLDQPDPEPAARRAMMRPLRPEAQGASTCVDACADTWPALARPATAGDDVDEALLGNADRPDDGSAQVTHNGWPLYHLSGDAAPGDTNGQGIGNVWFVVDAAGSAVSN